MTIKLDEITRALGEITQGEWFVDPEGPEYSVNYKGPLNTFRHVAMVSCYIQRHGDKEENEANAHLIANAPEWLRLLVERVRTLESAMKELQDDPYVYNVPRLVGIIQNTLAAKEQIPQEQD